MEALFALHVRACSKKLVGTAWILYPSIDFIGEIYLTVEHFFIFLFFSRELNHKVKGVSVSTWTSEEVDFILAHGNNQVNAVYMKHFSGDTPRPESGEVQRLRQWIRFKYQDKK